MSASSQQRYNFDTLLFNDTSRLSWITANSAETPEQRPAHLFRTGFFVNKNIGSATLLITAHGLYEVEINGKRVSDHYFTPGWTAYEKRLQVQQYDILKLLTPGANAIGVTVGRGWYLTPLSWSPNPVQRDKRPALLAQLIIHYKGGGMQVISSNTNWQSFTNGPITSSEIFDGEIYDANKKLNDWSKPGYKNELWGNVNILKEDVGNLVPTISEPVREINRLYPKRIITTPAGENIIDFGQNLVGWVELNYSGNKNDTVILQHAEVLDQKGNFYTANLRSAKQTNTYILDGAQKLYHPHFTYQGFRYVKVSGIKMLRPEYFTAVVLHSDLTTTGTFSCSDSLINKLQQNIVWGQKGNFVDIPSDCPQRDERLGWTGDAHMFFRTAAFNMNVRHFFEKWMLDMEAEQYEDGMIPAVVPNVFGRFMGGAAGWGDAAVIIPWEMFRVYGDTDLLRRQYPVMKKWVNYLQQHSTKGLRDKAFQFGDWLYFQSTDLMNGENAVTDEQLISQAFYCHSLELLTRAADILGYNKDYQQYDSARHISVAAFNREFVTVSGRLVSNTQTAYVLALHFDLLPESLRENAATRLKENIIDNDYHLTTGFIGTPYLCHVLSRFGMNDIAYKLLLQKTYPSWLYPVTKGATTIWERWDGIKPDGSFQDPMVNSFNHYAYGAIGDWMYRVVAGINEMEPGYKKILIYPQPDTALQHAHATLSTKYGTIVSSWKRIKDQIELDVTIPAQTTAVIRFNNKNISVGPGTYHYTF